MDEAEPRAGPGKRGGGVGVSEAAFRRGTLDKGQKTTRAKSRLWMIPEKDERNIVDGKEAKDRDAAPDGGEGREKEENGERMRLSVKSDQLRLARKRSEVPIEFLIFCSGPPLPQPISARPDPRQVATRKSPSASLFVPAPVHSCSPVRSNQPLAPPSTGFCCSLLPFERSLRSCLVWTAWPVAARRPLLRQLCSLPLAMTSTHLRCPHSRCVSM